MKKILSLLLCLNFMVAPAYCTITDDFVENSLDKTLKIKSSIEINVIDDFMLNDLDKTLKIKNVERKIIIDSFAENNKNKNVKTQTYGAISEVLPKIQANQNVVANKKLNLDFSNPIQVSIKNTFSTGRKVEEGDYLEFVTKKDVTIGKYNFPAGTPVKARVENVSLNKAMGVPSDLIVGNFSINGIPLRGEINKTGANRSLWVYPCTYSFMFFFGAGLLFIPIRGGHAKIRPSQVFTLYGE